MTSRTEMLHFRATPEEKTRIKENAGHAEVALSEWMRQRSLESFADEAREALRPSTREELASTRPAYWDCCGASRVSGKHAENCPLVVEQDAEADAEADEPVWNAFGQEVPVEPERADETYEQFMERRVPELCGENPSVAETGDAEIAARAEWAERG